jgi:hypothetical protein
VTGEALGRTLLRLDAAYCAVGGLLAVGLFAPLAPILRVPELSLVVIGLLTTAWAYIIAQLPRRVRWRRAVALVAAVNAFAAAGTAAIAAVSPTPGDGCYWRPSRSR